MKEINFFHLKQFWTTQQDALLIGAISLLGALFDDESKWALDCISSHQYMLAIEDDRVGTLLIINLFLALSWGVQTSALKQDA